MSNNCCPTKDIQMPLPQSYCPAYTTLPNRCANPFCEREADQEHHTVRKAFTRSWWTRDWALLYDFLAPVKVPLCLICHNRCTDNQATVRYEGGCGFFWDNGDGTAWTPLAKYRFELLEDDEGTTHQGDSDGPGNPPSSSSSGPEAHPAESASPPREANGPLSPGQSCPVCGRRKNHPKTAGSPVSSVKGFRMPAEVRESFDEYLSEWKAILNIEGEKFEDYKAVLTALAYCIQNGAAVKAEIGERVA